MRDILFRAKRIDNGEWVYGDLLTPTDFMNIWEISENTGMGDRYEVEPETVGQFTGLNDRTGKPIFEGDIITLEGDINGDVQFVQGVFGVEWYGVKNQGTWGAKHNLRTFEDGANEGFDVIGNIYDNPELVKEIKTK